MLKIESILFVVIVVFFTFYAKTVYSMNKVIYGTDGRMEIYEAPFYAELAKSTAIQMPNRFITPVGNDFQISPSTFKRSYDLCGPERFETQPALGRCTGFLVAPDILVTAGHCMHYAEDCKEKTWIFDYVAKEDGTVDSLIPEQNVYHCASIISQYYEETSDNDYAVIRLDRPALDRAPLKFRTAGKIDNYPDLVVIGNPSGLPTKVTLGGTMRSNTHDLFFTANLDTFGGNSGSPVFDMNTGLVEGIVVRGESDFNYDSDRSCFVLNKCSEGECRGEDVLRITNILPFIE